MIMVMMYMFLFYGIVRLLILNLDIDNVQNEKEN